MPATGGLVYAINHMHWIDIPIVGALSPRNIDFVAKAEAALARASAASSRWHGTIAVRRGESDRDAVRHDAPGGARRAASSGCSSRERGSRPAGPGTAQPGAAMVALQEDVPVVPIAIYGTQFWKVGNFAPCSIAFGEPVRFEGLPKGGRGYKEATVEIERRINVLFDWLAERARAGPPARIGAAAYEKRRAGRNGRDRRVPERRQVDARQPADGDAPGGRARDARHDARPQGAGRASGTGSSSC